MTILQIVQQASKELGISAPSAVVGATDLQTVQMLALAEALGNDLSTDFRWQKANKIHNITVEVSSQTGTTTDGSAVVTGLSDTSSFVADDWQLTGTGIPTETYIESVDSATQITMSNAATASGSVTLSFTKVRYDLPPDWNYQTNATEWDQTNHWPLIGPETAQNWALEKNGIVATGPRIKFRISDGKFQIWPLAVSESVLYFEYQSTSWITATGSTVPTKSAFTADTDSTIYRDRLMIDGIKYLFMSQKGFDTGQLARAYNIQVQKAKAQDAAAPVLSISPRLPGILITPANIPDGNIYGQTT